MKVFNFITSVISFQKEWKDDNENQYKNTIDSAELLKTIYSDAENQNFLFYNWHNNSEYCVWKMREKRFGGYHFDPFLYELAKSSQKLSLDLELGNYGSKLIFSQNEEKILISSMPNGFLFENGGIEDAINNLLDELKHNETIDLEGKFIISQNEEGVDTEDRIAKQIGRAHV